MWVGSQCQHCVYFLPSWFFSFWIRMRDESRCFSFFFHSVFLLTFWFLNGLSCVCERLLLCTLLCVCVCVCVSFCWTPCLVVVVVVVVVVNHVVSVFGRGAIVLRFCSFFHSHSCCCWVYLFLVLAFELRTHNNNLSHMYTYKASPLPI